LIIDRGNCVDISCYSNYWEDLVGWKAKGGQQNKTIGKNTKMG